MTQFLTDHGHRAPDAHGQAALMLVESLIHGLTEQQVITVRQALAIIDVALESQLAVANEIEPPAPEMKHAAELLASLAASLETEILG